jgi:hypothetical protein
MRLELNVLVMLVSKDKIEEWCLWDALIEFAGFRPCVDKAFKRFVSVDNSVENWHEERYRFAARAAEVRKYRNGQCDLPEWLK